MSTRFVRQILVSEIGTAGQARIERTVAKLAIASEASEVAELYARRAGFAEVSFEPAAEQRAQTWTAQSPSVQAVLAGSRCALLAIRKAVKS
jgi:hypothetical protein